MKPPIWEGPLIFLSAGGGREPEETVKPNSGLDPDAAQVFSRLFQPGNKSN
ncbi:hypothetical protein X474_06210 [Dethiosulfatarculus sandiegensis]|uniref:Uncharacterized protein n=1 Tax=Dethiosulfatarculus sandiegensis TaxID=1429043 RepID=A0A0D2JG72_9BACT|nr:hypothetical protein X474_06210 [Dethiosulfatarculus sandiegensis]